MVNSLRSMYARLSFISGLLAADRSDPLGPSPNLLPIHYHLTELETFRNETLTQAKKNKAGGAEQTARLERYFDRLGETIEAFEAHYFRLARELLELARNGNASVAVKIAKIAEVEGSRDQKAIAIKMVKKAGSMDVAARFRSIQAEARTIKHYRAKVVEAIKDGCRTSVERSYARHGDNGIAWLEDLDWIYEDLVIVEKDLVPMFPPDWKVRFVVVGSNRTADPFPPRRSLRPSASKGRSYRIIALPLTKALSQRQSLPQGNVRLFANLGQVRTGRRLALAPVAVHKRVQDDHGQRARHPARVA